MSAVAVPVVERPSRAAHWWARGIVVLVVAFLTFSGVVKLLPIADVDQSFVELGLSPAMRTPLGVLELVCTLLYAVPRTRALGTILLTGYLGGAIVTHWRVGHPLPSHTLFPLYVGALSWTGLLLRERRLAAELLATLRRR